MTLLLCIGISPSASINLVRKIFILTYLFLFFDVGSVLAIDPPNLISPQNNSTVSSGPTFNWQAVLGSVEYNILIDDEPTVTSPYAKTPYYPTNPSYSPQNLNPGTYYWKVKVKDGSGNWSGWSNIWSFTLSTATPTPTPSPTPSPTPTSTPSSSSSSNSSLFSISGTPSQVNSDQSFSTSVNLSLSGSPNTFFYLKGAFKKSDGSNYFGKTKVAGNWVKNSSTYTSQYKITTDSSGNWSGSLEIQPDSEDSGFTGSGDYIVKLARYTSSGSGPTWSNDSNITIVQASVTNQGTTDQQPSAEISLTSTSKSTIPSPPTQTKTTLEKATSVPKLNYQVASVAAATASATPSAKFSVKNQKQVTPILLTGMFLVFAGASSLGYIYLKRR